MRYIDSYKLSLSKTRLLSQSSSFLVALLVSFELISLLRSSFYAPGEFENWSGVVVGIAFLSAISVTFAIRFILLFFPKTEYLWSSQLLWLIGWMSICGYMLVTAKVETGSFFGVHRFDCMDCFYGTTFSFVSSRISVLFLIFYVWVSPIRQVLTLGSPLLIAGFRK